MKHSFSRATRALSLSLLAAALAGTAATAQAKGPASYPVTGGQRATAQQVAAKGVPLSALAPNAPDEYTVRRGDTLWRIAGMFLKSPWRWPELWGMNMQTIRNPHLIYPGQQLYLERTKDGRAILRARRGVDGQPGGTVRVSPRTRVEMLDASPIPTLQPHMIEPFLAEMLVIDQDDTFKRAPRIVALAETDRQLIAHGDRAYARGPEDEPLLLAEGLPTDYRIYRAVFPLKDPVTGEVLGYEGQYVGQGELVRGESISEVEDEKALGERRKLIHPAEAGNEGVLKSLFGKPNNASNDGDCCGDCNCDEAPAAAAAPVAVDTLPVAATLDIVKSKEDIHVGDRLLPEPPREWRSFTPHAPDLPIDARVINVYSSTDMRFAGGSQIVAINKGLRDGVESGQVLAVLSAGQRIIDRTEGERERVQLPDERNGLGMVFRVFERVSYVLLIESRKEVKAGDKLTNPV